MSLETSLQPYNLDPRDGLGPLHSNEIIIGLALGSPRESPQPSLPHEYFDKYTLPSLLQHERQELDDLDNVSHLFRNTPPSQSARTHTLENGLKRSGSKWKNLGGLFTRKAPSAPAFGGQSFYLLDEPNQREWSKPAHALTLPEQLSAQHPTRGINTVPGPAGQVVSSVEPFHESGAKAFLRRASTRKKAIRKRARAQRGGSLEDYRSSPARARLENRNVPEEQADTSTWPELDASANQKTPAGAASLSRASPLLKVEIPNVELERYSVMFGDLLPSHSAKSPPLRSSRAQSQLRELKPAAVAKENKLNGPTLSPLSSNPPLFPNPPRPVHSRENSSSSTGSKISTKSANYGLFPPASPPKKRNPARKPLSKPSPLSRSVTAPNATATSPPRPTIQSSRSQGLSELMIEVQQVKAPSPPNRDSIATASRHHRRTSSLNPSDLSAGSSTSNFIEQPDHFYKDDYSRPSSANEARKETFTRRAFPIRKSSMKAPRGPPATPPTQSLQAPPKFPSSHEPSQPISREGEISIARQISISRRQRNLVPIVPQIARPPM